MREQKMCNSYMNVFKSTKYKIEILKNSISKRKGGNKESIINLK